MKLVFEPLLKDFETETIAEYFRDMVAEIWHKQHQR